jgi:hypothetical protein
MAATTATAAADKYSATPDALEQRETGPMVPGFRDSQVADSLQRDEGVEEESERGLTTRVFDQMASFNRLVTGGVTLAVGILVYNEVIGALPDSGGAINQTGVTTTVESAFQLAPVALIVIIAAVILAQVMGFRQ